MVRRLDILPDFTPRTLDFGRIPVYSYRGNLKDELSKGRITERKAIGFLRNMLRIREFESAIADMRSGAFKPREDFEFVGATHLSVGQEAVAVGSMAAIRPVDYITSTHRGHGHCIAKGMYSIEGMDRKRLLEFLGEGESGLSDDELREKAERVHLYRTMAEFLGKEDGYCRGRGGGMHIADFEFSNNLGANAIVGGSLGIATGAAIAQMLLKSGRIVLCMAGDGAVNTGICHESFNMACMASFPEGVPVIYLIENNQYGMTGQQKGEVTGIDYLARRGVAYSMDGMHAEVVNGMDVLAVFDAVDRAQRLVRDEKHGPVLLEVMTYRYLGHSLSDDSLYRSKREIEAWRKEDPVERLKAEIIGCGIMSPEEIARLGEEVRSEIRSITVEAANAPDPDPKGMYEGLYSDTTSEELPPDLPPSRPVRRPKRPVRDRNGNMLYRKAVFEAMQEEMLRDSRVVFFGEDVAEHGGAFKATYGLYEVFGPERVWNTAISEAAIVGAAVGAAMTGLRPVVEIMYIDFVLLAMDQIGNQAAKARYMFGGKARIPMVIRTQIGGGKGYAGQHSQSLESILAHIPGLKIAIPSTPYDVKGLLKTAIRDDNPVIFIENQLLYGEMGPVPLEEYTIPFGVANIRREGRDLTIVSYSRMVNVALEAAEIIHRRRGIEAEVIDPRTLYPFDYETVAKSVEKTGHLLVLSQACETGSFTKEIAYQIQNVLLRDRGIKVLCMGTPDVPPPMARTLERAYLPSPESVSGAIGRLVGVEIS